MTQDMLFDLAELTRQAVAATPWHGSPLGYVTDYHTPSDLDDAFDRFCAEFGHFGSYSRSHMWHRAPCSGTAEPTDDGHEIHLFMAHADCKAGDHDHDPLPGGLMYQAICPTCRWHDIAASERAVVEAWHDHAWPGWRDLPIAPGSLVRGGASRRLREWVDDHYPSQWRRGGAPILSERDAGGTRPVPGRSPFRGYDLPNPARGE